MNKEEEFNHWFSTKWKLTGEPHVVAEVKTWMKDGFDAGYKIATKKALSLFTENHLNWEGMKSALQRQLDDKN